MNALPADVLLVVAAYKVPRKVAAKMLESATVNELLALAAKYGYK